MIVKTHCDDFREGLAVENSQLGVMKGGYETEIHAMRALAKKCLLDGDVILLEDFANAFNDFIRNLLIKLISAYFLELAPLASWLFAEEADLHLDSGETLISSEGGQQGCGLGNESFVCSSHEVYLETGSERRSSHKGSILG